MGGGIKGRIPLSTEPYDEKNYSNQYKEEIPE